MKKLFYIIMASLAFVALPSCNEEDDIRKDIDDLNLRLEVLLPQIENLNTQIDNYYDMVKGSVFITSYTKSENGDYTIELSNGEKMTVYSGEPAEEIPSVSINADGFWCYTVKGETSLIYDSENKPLKATPTDGPAGLTPKVGVDENGYWIYSVDNGKTWLSLGGEVANPELRPGSLFSDVKLSDDGNAMVFTLSAGGDPVTVPLYSDLSMIFADGSNALNVAKGTTASKAVVMTGVVNVVIENTPLYVELKGNTVNVKAPADLATGQYTVHFRIFSENNYAKLIVLNVTVTD